jgi:hypothetical protein
LEKLKKGELEENEMLEQFDYIIDSIFKVFEKTKKCFWELAPANYFLIKSFQAKIWSLI